jgi:hypothetical protein
MEAVDTPVFMDVKPCKLISASMVFVPLPECLYHAVRQGVGRLRVVKDAEQAPGNTDMAVHHQTQRVGVGNSAVEIFGLRSSQTQAARTILVAEPLIESVEAVIWRGRMFRCNRPIPYRFVGTESRLCQLAVRTCADALVLILSRRACPS